MLSSFHKHYTTTPRIVLGILWQIVVCQEILHFNQCSNVAHMLVPLPKKIVNGILHIRWCVCFWDKAYFFVAKWLRVFLFGKYVDLSLMVIPLQRTLSKPTFTIYTIDIPTHLPKQLSKFPIRVGSRSRVCVQDEDNTNDGAQEADNGPEHKILKTPERTSKTIWIKAPDSSVPKSIVALTSAKRVC